MEKNTPNPIKEYYIAYMDVLGYKAFFKEHPEDIPSLLDSIDDAIKRTIAHISSANTSPIVMQMANIHIESKIFSDNILLYMETTNSPFEPMRVLFFLQVISDIQRGFVIGYGLFLRGGVKRGKMSMNADYVFGQGLIDTVELEEKIAIYPRIIVDEELYDYAVGIHYYTQEEIHWGIPIEDAIKNKQPVSDENMNKYLDLAFRVRMNGYVQFVACNLIWKWDDGLYFVNYLQRIDPVQMFGNDAVKALKKQLQVVSPSDYALVTQQSIDHDACLQQNKIRIEEHLRCYGHNEDIDITDKGKAIKQAELREYILKKYIWAMAYHNRFCRSTNKMEFYINTECNCDTRFLKTIINVK